jgi:hypothetical protein
MTVHMFRVFIGRGKMNISDLESRITDWVDANPEWANDTVNHTLTERNTKIDGSGETYYAVDVRFTQDDTKSNLLQKLTDKLKNKVAWYRVGYHLCDHDEPLDGVTTDDGMWGDTAEWTAKDVTIPTDIPNFQ